MIEIEWSNEDQAYVATTMLHPYLSGIGSTKNNAEAHLKTAIALEEDSIASKALTVAPWLDEWMKTIGAK